MVLLADIHHYQPTMPSLMVLLADIHHSDSGVTGLRTASSQNEGGTLPVVCCWALRALVQRQNGIVQGY